MKTIVTLLAVAAILFTATSCKNCTECTKYPGDTIELCKKDYASDDSYNAAYKYTIAQGYKCD
ncbi:MAG: hypothetical protein JST49_15170 [Bacteroidetes bacterium]|nr:hypothetical protein [Bacteroidota bacterium]